VQGRAGIVSSRKAIVLAILAGILLAGVPMAAFNFWLDALGQRQDDRESETVTNRTVGLAEARLGRTIAVLDELALRGVASCRGDHLDAFRKANLGSSPIKELSVVGPDGQTLCSDLGLAPAERKVLASQRVLERPEVLLEAVRVGDKQEPFLRVRRPAVAGFNSLAALIPSDMLLARVSTRGNLITSNTRMSMANGVVIGEIGSAPDPEKFVGKSQSSNVYGLTVTTSMQRTTSEDHPDLQMIGASITAILALVIFMFMVVLPKRERDNPVIEMENALKAGEFVPYYQPVVDIINGRLRGAEVLMRWRKPDGSVIAPAAFIPLAESSGLITEMTRHIMRAVRDELAETICDRPFMRIGFNLSAHHFNDEVLVADMREIFEGSSLRLTQIVLEVTERQPLESLTIARRVIAALQGLGIKIAIDDVGAGHSGLSYMLKLGVDIIKIDKMFIDALGHDTNSTTIIETLVDLARNMRMDIVAEGVENFEQVIALRERGIRAAQGYVFAPPLPGSSFIELVEAIDPQTDTVRRNPATSGLIAMVQRKAS